MAEIPPRDDALTGYAGNLNAQQQEALDKIKAKYLAGEYADALKSNPDGDSFLLRFLRASMKDRTGARVFDVDAASARLDETLAFRKRVGADEVRAKIEAGDLPAKYIEYRDAVRPRYGFIDKATGRYVCFERFGLLAANVKVAAYTEEEWETFIVWDLEERLHFIRQEAKKRGYGITQQVLVFDLKDGGGLANLFSSRVGLMRSLSKIAGWHYPELIAVVHLVRAPFLITKIVEVVQTFLDPVTVAKLRVYADIPKDLLVSTYGAEDVPGEFGGKNPVVVPGTVHAA